MSGRRTTAGAALPPSFYERDTQRVARELLGSVLVSRVGGVWTAGRIVETEAYVGPHDPASHAAERIGRTARNAAMFGPPGRAYVYRIYGLHWCLNAVTGPEGQGTAVLIRALEPLEGLEVMAERRATGSRSGAAPPPLALASGPARLAQALGITGELDTHPLDAPPLWIEAGAPVPPDAVAAGPRIGVTRAADWPLRFVVRGSRWLSR